MLLIAIKSDAWFGSCVAADRAYPWPLQRLLMKFDLCFSSYIYVDHVLLSLILHHKLSSFLPIVLIVGPFTLCQPLSI